MRLLILTQKVDKNDPILGFFHNWINSFSRHFDKIVVVGLYVGEHSLPSNVSVLSLGKERGVGRMGYLLNFFHIIWRERKNYDSVFVHMNQEYVILAGWLWRLMGKKLCMWRNHYSGGILTDLASIFCHKVFCTSKKSYTAKYVKTKIMPVGIDTDIFKPDSEILRDPKSILVVGRVSPSKKIEMIVSALIDLKNRGNTFVADIYGDALQSDTGYYESLKAKVKEHHMDTMVRFHSGVANTSLPSIYRSHKIFINASPSGMYDKTILEAAACGCKVLASSSDAQVDISGIIGFTDLRTLADGLEDGLKSSVDPLFADEQHALVSDKHSLTNLAQRLEKEINE